MRKGNGLAALGCLLVLGSPVCAQSTTAKPSPFQFTPSQLNYQVVDTSKAILPSPNMGAMSLGNFQSTPINVSGAIQQSYTPINFPNSNVTRAIAPRQPTNMFVIPNVFSRVTLGSFPTLQPRFTSVQFPAPAKK
jgi:hypothetical protein